MHYAFEAVTCKHCYHLQNYQKYIFAKLWLTTLDLSQTIQHMQLKENALSPIDTTLTQTALVYFLVIHTWHVKTSTSNVSARSELIVYHWNIKQCLFLLSGFSSTREISFASIHWRREDLNWTREPIAFCVLWDFPVVPAYIVKLQMASIVSMWTLKARNQQPYRAHNLIQYSCSQS